MQLYSRDDRVARARHAWLRDCARVTLLLGLLAGLGSLGGELRTGALQNGPATSATQEGVAWEGRRLLARAMWVKSEQVLHGGVEHAARTGSQQHDHGEPGNEEEAHGHDLAIPSRREDFRGLLGDLERSVKPYAEEAGMDAHRDQSQTVPYFRLMTWLDPHFTQGYTTGAAILCDAGKHAEMGLRFLQEGVRHNPQSCDIQMELGRFYLVYFRDFVRAEAHLSRALKLAPRGRELSEEEVDTLTDTFRWLALCHSGWQRPQEALRIARLGLRVIGPDVVLERVIERHRR